MRLTGERRLAANVNPVFDYARSIAGVKPRILDRRLGGWCPLPRLSLETHMKLRRFVAAAAVASTVIVAAPAASAQPAPEPLESVLREIRNNFGWEAQNVILVPAALSSLGFIVNFLGLNN